MRALRLVCSSGTLPPTVVRRAARATDAPPRATAHDVVVPGVAVDDDGDAHARRSSLGGEHRRRAAARTSRPCRGACTASAPRRPRAAPRRAGGPRRATRRGCPSRHRPRPVVSTASTRGAGAPRPSAEAATRRRTERHDDRAGDVADGGCRGSSTPRAARLAASVPRPSARASCSFTTQRVGDRERLARPATGGARLSTKRTPAAAVRRGRRSSHGSSPCVSTTAAAAMRRAPRRRRRRERRVRARGHDDRCSRPSRRR